MVVLVQVPVPERLHGIRPMKLHLLSFRLGCLHMLPELGVSFVRIFHRPPDQILRKLQHETHCRKLKSHKLPSPFISLQSSRPPRASRHDLSLSLSLSRLLQRLGFQSTPLLSVCLFLRTVVFLPPSFPSCKRKRRPQRWNIFFHIRIMVSNSDFLDERRSPFEP